jgi:hypothetical protein
VNYSIDHSMIRLAIRIHLIAEVPEFAEALTEGRVAWENRHLDLRGIERGKLGFREWLLPGSQAADALGQITGRGLYQLDVLTRKGEGSEKAEAVSDAVTRVMSPLRPPIISAAGGETIHIDRADRLTVSEFSEDWMSYGVSLSWRAYAGVS